MYAILLGILGGEIAIAKWSRLIGYGSGLEIVQFSLTKPEWAAPALGCRGNGVTKSSLLHWIIARLDGYF